MIDNCDLNIFVTFLARPRRLIRLPTPINDGTFSRVFVAALFGSAPSKSDRVPQRLRRPLVFGTIERAVHASSGRGSRRRIV
jgi:hypothetical protein